MQKIDVILQGNVPTPRKVRLSVLHSPFAGRTGRPPIALYKSPKRLFPTDEAEESSDGDVQAPFSKRRVSVIDMNTLQQLNEQTEEPEQLISRMIEVASPAIAHFMHNDIQIVHKEKEHMKPIDESSDNEELLSVDQEIVEKEEILKKLMDAMKGFATLKQEYEVLVHEITVLETERKELELSLEKATKPNASNPVAVEKLKERFLKVKEELIKMKNEKQTKENAYRIVQKESKQCEQLQRELHKLKEIKIQLMKAQKSQNQQHLRFKKESQSKMNVLKKLDVKKQKQMNCLKSELLKKQRVLGHKEREINRIQSKLKACEEHITQLLRIQNRGRGKLLEKSSSNVKEDRTSNGSMSGLETEHYVTSKNILHNLISDRIEYKYKKLQVGRKTATIKELQEELQEEVTELEKWNTAKNIWNKENDSADEMTRSEQMAQFDTEIRSAESNIDRITNELQMHRADVAELNTSLQNEDSTTCWEDIGKNVIVGCSQTQLQHILWETIEEKSELLSKQRDMNDAIVQYKEAEETSAERIAELEEQVADMAKELKTKLEEVEKSRVHDMWVLLQSKQSSEADEVANNIVFKRTQELETTLNAMVTQEYMLKEDNGLLKAENEKLKYQLKEMQMNNTTSDSSGVSDQLSDIWAKLGLSFAEREVYLQEIATVQQIKQNAMLDEMQSLLRCSIAQEDNLQNEIEMLCNIMDMSEANYIDADATLLRKIEKLKSSSTSLNNELSNRLKQLTAMQTKLQYLITDMGLDVSGLPASLAKLHKAQVSSESTALTASGLLAQGIMLSAADLTNWEQGLRQLSITHANHVHTAATLHTEALALCRELDIRTSEQLQKMELGCDDDIPQALALLAMESLIQNASICLPGNPKLILHFERIVMALKTTKVNRETISKELVMFVRSMKSYFSMESSPELEAVLASDSSPYGVVQITALQAVVSNMPMILDDNSFTLLERIRVHLADIGVTPEHFESRMANLLTTRAHVEPITTFDEIVAHVQEFAMFIDESWLKDIVYGLQSAWQLHRSSFLHVLLLLSECNRLEKYIDSMREMQKYDTQLVKHIHEMEDFETTSKQDRMKVLSGMRSNNDIKDNVL